MEPEKMTDEELNKALEENKEGENDQKTEENDQKTEENDQKTEENDQKQEDKNKPVQPIGRPFQKEDYEKLEKDQLVEIIVKQNKRVDDKEDYIQKQNRKIDSQKKELERIRVEKEKIDKQAADLEEKSVKINSEEFKEKFQDDPKSALKEYNDLEKDKENIQKQREFLENQEYLIENKARIDQEIPDLQELIPNIVQILEAKGLPKEHINMFKEHPERFSFESIQEHALLAKKFFKSSENTNDKKTVNVSDEALKKKPKKPLPDSSSVDESGFDGLDEETVTKLSDTELDNYFKKMKQKLGG